MSILWLEKLSKRIHKTMKPIPTIPEFLNTENKWNQVVEKFENILYKVLDDDNISTPDTFKIMKQMQVGNLLIRLFKISLKKIRRLHISLLIVKNKQTMLNVL